jgi:hypothetical protein
MNWKFVLRFTGDPVPALAQIQFWARDSTKSEPSSEMVNADGISADTPNQQVFHWTAGVRALAELLLKAFATEKPYSFRMSGGRGTPAQSLAEAVTQKHAKGDDKTWVQKAFTPVTEPELRKLVPGFFAAKLNYDRDFFSVRMGRNWQGAQFQVFQEGQLVPQEKLLELALRIQPTPRQELEIPQEKLAVKLLLDIFDPRTQQVAPFRDCPLPLRADVGIIIRAELNRPAHVCIIWINSRGIPQPLYPWQGFDWVTPVGVDKIQQIALPEAQPGERLGFYPIGGRSGIETAILLARDEPLPASLGSTLFALLRATTVRYSQLRLHNPREPVEFCGPTNERFAAPRTRLEHPQFIRDPFLRFKNDLLGKLSAKFGLIKVLAFAVAATSGSTK